MVQSSNLNMIKNLNIHKILNNSKLNYFIILLLGLFIGCYNLLDIRLKASLSRFINYPLILIVIVSTILFIGYYNITLGLLMIVCLLYNALSNKLTKKSRSIKRNSN